MAIRTRVPRPSSPLLLPARVLRRRYEVGPQVGEGSFGYVSRGYDAASGATVAIKQARPDALRRAHLQHEAAVLATLTHECIPSYLDTFEESGEWYLIEAWRSGVPLSQQRFFSLEQVLQIGQQCCSILSYLHLHGWVHRDLKPDNLLLDGETLSLLDFGCTRAIGEKPRCEGTKGYVAPEQWRRGAISFQADIYSLGMLLGCLLTDCTPEEVRQVGTFARLWETPAMLPSELLPLIALLDRMIALRPAHRPSLQEVQQILAEQARS